MQFPSTCWTELRRASLNGDTQARNALEDLCQRYYAPLKQLIVWKGIPDLEAEDILHDFLVGFLADASWKRADRARGPFRAFLRGALMHHLADAARTRRRQKRGGGVLPLSLDAEEIDLGLPNVAAADSSRFDRAWAMGLLEAALGQVQAGLAEGGKEPLGRELLAYLPGSAPPPPYEITAARLGLSVAGLKTQIHRLRQLFRRALRDEVARTVSAPHEIDGELRYLQIVLSEEVEGPVDLAKPTPPKNE